MGSLSHPGQRPVLAVCCLSARQREPTLAHIARELVETVRKNVTIDWTLRENVRAQLRVIVKRILRKYGYPPDKQEKATRTVLEQAELLSAGWAS
jgi:type I restriction enzyme R subunit